MCPIGLYERELFKEAADRSLQGLGEAEEMQGGAVAHTALDAAHIAPPNVGVIRERFLGQPSFLSKLPDTCSELL